MTTYDERAIYNQPEIVNDDTSDSHDSDVMVISQTEILPNVSTLHNYAVPSGGANQRHPNRERREPPAERHGGGDFPDITPLLLQDVHNFLSMADSVTGGMSRNNPRYGLGDEADTAHSGWESPTPGPSFLTPSQPDFSLLMSDLPLDFSLPRTSTNDNNGAAAAASNEPTQGDGNDSDIQIIGYEKPKAERTPPTPILISSDADESIDVVTIHKQKKKHKKSCRHHSRHEHVRSRSRSQSHRRHRSGSNTRRQEEDSRRRRSRSRSRSYRGSGSWWSSENSREWDEGRRDRWQSRVRPVGIALDIHRKSSTTGKSGHYHWQFSNRGNSRSPEIYSTHRFYNRRSDNRQSSSETETTERTFGSSRSHRRHSPSHSSTNRKHPRRKASSYESRDSSIEVIEKSSRKRKHKKRKKNKKHRKHKRVQHSIDSDKSDFEVADESSERGQLKSVINTDQPSTNGSSTFKKHPTGHKSTKKSPSKSSASVASHVGAYVDIMSVDLCHDVGASESVHEVASGTVQDQGVLDSGYGDRESLCLSNPLSGESSGLGVCRSSEINPLFPILQFSLDGEDQNWDEFSEPATKPPSTYRNISFSKTVDSKCDEPENADSAVDDQVQYKTMLPNLPILSVGEDDENMEIEKEKEKTECTSGEQCAEKCQTTVLDPVQDLDSDRLQSIVNFKQTCIDELADKLLDTEKPFLNGCAVESVHADNFHNALENSFNMESLRKVPEVGDTVDSLNSFTTDKSHIVSSLSLKYRNGVWKSAQYGEPSVENTNDQGNTHASLENVDQHKSYTQAVALENMTRSPSDPEPPKSKEMVLEPGEIDTTSVNNIKNLRHSAPEQKSDTESESEKDTDISSQPSLADGPLKSVSYSDQFEVRPGTSKSYEENSLSMQNALSDISSVYSDNLDQDIPLNNPRCDTLLDEGWTLLVLDRVLGSRSTPKHSRTDGQKDSNDSDSNSETSSDDSESSSDYSSDIQCTVVPSSSRKENRNGSSAGTPKRNFGTPSEVVTIDDDSDVDCTGVVQQTLTETQRNDFGSDIDIVGIHSSESDSDIEVMSHHVNHNTPNRADRTFDFSSDWSDDFDTSARKRDRLHTVDGSTGTSDISEINVTDLSATEPELSPWQRIQEPIIDVEIVTSGNDTYDSEASEIDVVNDNHRKEEHVRLEDSASNSDLSDIVVDISPPAKHCANVTDSGKLSPTLEIDSCAYGKGNRSDAISIIAPKPSSTASDNLKKTGDQYSSDSDESVSVTSDEHDTASDEHDTASDEHDTASDEHDTASDVNKLSSVGRSDNGVPSEQTNVKHIEKLETDNNDDASLSKSEMSDNCEETDDNMIAGAREELLSRQASEILDVGPEERSILRCDLLLTDSFSTDYPSETIDTDGLPVASTSDVQNLGDSSNLNSGQFVENLKPNCNMNSTPMHTESSSLLEYLPEFSRASPLDYQYDDCEGAVGHDQDIVQNTSTGTCSFTSPQKHGETSENICDELDHLSTLKENDNSGDDSCDEDSMSDNEASCSAVQLNKDVYDSDSSCTSRPDVEEDSHHDTPSDLESFIEPVLEEPNDLLSDQECFV
jgi:hypothetical protein